MNRKQRRAAAKKNNRAAPARPRKTVGVQDAMDEAKALHEQNRFADAAALYAGILQEDAQRARVFAMIGADAIKHGDSHTGIALLEDALAADPTDAANHRALGMAHLSAGEPTKAEAILRQAVVLDETNDSAHVNLGAALDATGKQEAAVASFERALHINPDNIVAQQNLGAILVQMNRPVDGETHSRCAIALAPNAPEPHNNLAVALRDQGRIDEAIAACRKAIALVPDYAEGHVHLADCLLLAGHYTEGFGEYEWRDRVGDVVLPGDQLASSRWRGEDIGGKTILVIGEQGFGDTLHFCRYAPLLKQRGAAGIVFAVQTALKDLCTTLPGVDAIVGSGEALPDHDLHVPLLSLPHLLQTALGTIPGDTPYLFAPPAQAERWAEALKQPAGFRIGIAWQGNPLGAGDRGRSIPLDHFIPLARLANIRLVSLQKGAGHEQLARLPDDVRIEDAGSRCESFADTAAVMANLDLVITSDTAVAHLAGALGRPVWAALKYAADWRWLLDRDDSPWYPTMRLFRQKTPGDWDNVFISIVEALKNTLEEHHAGS